MDGPDGVERSRVRVRRKEGVLQGQGLLLRCWLGQVCALCLPGVAEKGI